MLNLLHKVQLSASTKVELDASYIVVYIVSVFPLDPCLSVRSLVFKL